VVQFNARRPDLTGRVFGRLTVEGFAGKDRHHNRLWHCRCACGNSTVVRSRCLLMGSTRGCGCLQREFIRQRNTTHGKSDLPEYQAWADLIQRCTNPNVEYYDCYGGRGISVCSRWLNSFEAFFEDMGSRPSPKHSIDRINNDGNYEPTNCRWATASQQNANKRRPRRKACVTNAA
jgi:hypothetical protein